MRRDRPARRDGSRPAQAHGIELIGTHASVPRGRRETIELALTARQRCLVDGEVGGGGGVRHVDLGASCRASGGTAVHTVLNLGSHLPTTRAKTMRVPALDPRSTVVTEPCHGAPIDLVIAGGWRLSVRTNTDDPSEGDVRLVPVNGAAVVPGEGDTIAASLEWRSPRGLVRRQGILRADPRGFVLADAHEAVVMQRRNFARVRCAVRVNVHGAARESDLITRTVDLSVGGMLVEQAAMLSIGERVAFTLNLPDDTVVRGEGSIVRATQFGHRAIQFDPFPRADEQTIARFVFAQEREGRSTAAYV